MHAMQIIHSLNGIILAADEGVTATDHVLQQLLGAVVFSVIGLIVFALAIWVIEKITPFSLHREIEEDQNTALAILVGSIMIGISIIIAAAIHG